MGMTRQEQLDAVVRNYGEWKPSEELNRAAWNSDRGLVEFFSYRHHKGDKIGDYFLFTLLEVEQRKAELQNKPSWADAPKGVKYYAQDPDGDWYWFKRQPVPYPCGTYWEQSDGSHHAFAFCSGEVIGDWRDTIEERPEPEKDEALKVINASEEKKTIHLLEERGERYGDFEVLAEAIEEMEAQLYFLPGLSKATPAHREAAHMIIQKLCRAFNGDPHYTDNWADIAGYARLAEASCKVNSQPK